MLYAPIFVGRVDLGEGLVFGTHQGSDYSQDCLTREQRGRFKYSLRLGSRTLFGICLSGRSFLTQEIFNDYNRHSLSRWAHQVGWF